MTTDAARMSQQWVGEVGAADVGRVAERIHAAPGQRFVVDCQAATGITGEALVALAVLIREAETRGGQLRLRNVPASVLAQIEPGLTVALLDPQLVQRLIDFLTRARAFLAEQGAGFQDAANN